MVPGCRDSADYASDGFDDAEGRKCDFRVVDSNALTAEHMSVDPQA